MNSADKAYSVESGMIINEQTGGPFITGGTASPIGLGMPSETFYLQTTASGVVIWHKTGAGDTASDWVKYRAEDVSFDDTNTPDIQPANEVQTAIEKVFQLSIGTSRGITFCQYNGNAQSGRYFEFFSGISSNDAPIFTSKALDILEIVTATSVSDATCTIGWYDLATMTLLHTTTLTAEKRKIEIGAPIFSVPANAELAVKVDSGSIIKPHIYFVLKGGS